MSTEHDIDPEDQLTLADAIRGVLEIHKRATAVQVWKTLWDAEICYSKESVAASLRRMAREGQLDNWVGHYQLAKPRKLRELEEEIAAAALDLYRARKLSQSKFPRLHRAVRSYLYVENQEGEVA